MIALLLALSIISDARPPLQYQHNNSFEYVAMNVAAMQKKCGSYWHEPKKDWPFINMCHIKGKVYGANPCLYPDTQSFAHQVCHELGHRNGWSKYHPK